MNIGEEEALNRFWNATEVTVTSGLETYCANHFAPGCDSDVGDCCVEVTGQVVLDIEHPFHPKKFHEYAAVQEEVGDVVWQGGQTVACRAI